MALKCQIFRKMVLFGGSGGFTAVYQFYRQTHSILRIKKNRSLSSKLNLIWRPQLFYIQNVIFPPPPCIFNKNTTFLLFYEILYIALNLGIMDCKVNFVVNILILHSLDFSPIFIYYLRMEKEIHKFDKLNQNLSGVFHPSGLEIISNTEVFIFLRQRKAK